MPIQRSGPTPPYYEYVSKFALVDQKGKLPLEVSQLRAEPLKIPTFQRGISWGADDVLRFLDSNSALYGNVIIGQLSGVGLLVDGLQRFAVGTILLNLLYLRVLAPTPSNISASTGFVRLKAMVGSFQPVFSNNHLQLSQHSREAIRTQYNQLYKELEGLIDDSLAGPKLAEFAGLIERCFLDKQIAIDNYFNFSTHIDLANTFIGLNTVRVELSPVDLIRAYIVDRAETCTPPWPPEVIPETENDITDTFIITNGSPRRDLLPTATVILKCLQGTGSPADNRLIPDLVFPSWHNLQESEVGTFLDFLGQTVEAIDQNNYLLEIRESGALPFAIVILFYYQRQIHNNQTPSFLTGGTTENPQLHRFLRATYRALIEGTVGRLGPIAENAIAKQFATLDEAAEAVVRSTSSGSLNSDPPADWLSTHLASVDLKKARRVFNASLLPARLSGGGAYSPKRFGRKEGEWQIDHLMPVRKLTENSPGFDEGNSLRNFAPLPASYNRSASNTPCSAKLGAGGIYEVCAAAAETNHPVIEWLIKNQAAHKGDLDNQRFLQPNTQPNIGDARIEAIANLILSKL